MIPGLIVNRVAGGAVGARRIVMPHTTAGQFVVSNAAGAFLGVCSQPGGAASGERMDITVSGLVEVVAGGAVTAGAPVTSDANGAAVAAAPGAGVNARVLGYAHEAAASGDIFRVQLSLHTMQG
jgi:hypothetical protein